MKKLFVAVLAIAALAACNKEEATILNTSKKSVSMTILNGGEATRAITTASGEENFECAAEADLTVLFADATGKVVESRALSAAAEKVVGTAEEGQLVPTTYTFHRLPETVMQVGVIALRGAAEPASLADAKALWKTETKDAQFANIVVYGEDDELSPADYCAKAGDEEFPFFNAAVRVAPAHTRFEVLSFQCMDLGRNEYGYKQIDLVKMTMGDDEQALGQSLKAETDVATPSGVNVADEDKAWSWNWIAPHAFSPITVDLVVTGKNYTVAIPEKTLTINKIMNGETEVTEFAVENIYKLNVPFYEKNIDATDAYICVDVEVTIAKWVVNTLTPVFKTE